MPGLVRSPANTAVSPSISPAACSAMSPSRSLIRTWAPCAASSSAVARPMPRAEPVTIADLPSSTPIVSRSPSIGRGSRSYICLAGWPVACARVPPFRAPAPATAAAPRAGSGSRGAATALGLDEDQLSVGQAIDLTDRLSLAGGGLMGRGGGERLLGARGLLLGNDAIGSGGGVVRRGGGGGGVLRGVGGLLGLFLCRGGGGEPRDQKRAKQEQAEDHE